MPHATTFERTTRQTIPLPKPAAARNVAIDAFRGLVMFLMMGEILRLAKVAAAYPGNWFWGVLAWNQTHTEWFGCSLHDLIQPSFSFLVGVALPYSIASRLAKGATFSTMLGHAIWRSVLLAWLGIFLRSLHSPQTNFTFEDTLTQIGLGYTFLFLLGFRSERVQWISFGAILFCYWLAWALYPAPGLDFNYAAVGVPPDWHHNFTGFASHWNKNSNLGQAVDVWFLNLLPRPKPFLFNSGGYLTLSFIPTLGTMILGLIAGQWLRKSAPSIPLRRFLSFGAAGIALGLALHVTGVAPVVKRVWTPGWTIFSGGACFLMLAAFCWLIEMKGHKRWAFPLVVIGTNSIAAYLMAHLFERFVLDSFHIHLGQHFFAFFGPGTEPLIEGWAVLGVYWLMLWWMYKRKVFLRV